jgi:hypothetical protein
MKKLGLLVLIFGVMGLALSGCAKKGTVFSKSWATKELNKTLSEENVVIGKGFFNYFNAYNISILKEKPMPVSFDDFSKMGIDSESPNGGVLKHYIGKPAGYFTGHVDICRPKYGTQFGRKIYGCTYTMVFHPSKNYIKLFNFITLNNKVPLPLNIPTYIYKQYSTKRAGIAFKKDKKTGVWKAVAFNFNPYGSPFYK